jgi:hypothetical protein
VLTINSTFCFLQRKYIREIAVERAGKLKGFTRGRQINGQTEFLKKIGISIITKIEITMEKSTDIFDL